MGGSKTAILAQVVHFYSDGVGHITIGVTSWRLQIGNFARTASVRQLLTRN